VPRVGEEEVVGCGALHPGVALGVVINGLAGDGNNVRNLLSHGVQCGCGGASSSKRE
jgi:hypothetical protein